MAKQEYIKGQELLDLGNAVASLLDGWTVMPKNGEQMTSVREEVILAKRGMEFCIRGMYQHPDRISIDTWTWPNAIKYERGEKTTERMTPRDLHDPKEETPSITVSRTKTPQQIARDIKTRFLPHYERIYARCQEKADSYSKYYQEAQNSWEEVCALIGKNPAHQIHYLDVPDTHATIKQNGSHTRFEADLNAAQMKKVIAALKEA